MSVDICGSSGFVVRGSCSILFAVEQSNTNNFNHVLLKVKYVFLFYLPFGSIYG
jgi:hypothetical protein